MASPHASHPRILATAVAFPPQQYTQSEILGYASDLMLGPDWRERPEDAESAKTMERLFTASHVQHRHSSVNLPVYYSRRRTTGERMAEYATLAPQIGEAALATALDRAAAHVTPSQISDFVVVSCTGYSAPGLDVSLARACTMPQDVRRVLVGHMGCFGAIVGLRQALASVRAHPGAVAALLSVELPSLHFAPTLDRDMLTGFALFGDAAATVVLGDVPGATGPELVDTYCSADFAAADQMSWTITDQGFVMTLSPRVPVSLRRSIGGVVERLLAPHGLAVQDVSHWLVHPGGPSILEAIQGKLELSDDQMALSWQVLRDHGNCSSATVLIELDTLVRSGATRPGEWGVMMAFGPGLTLETCLLRF